MSSGSAARVRTLLAARLSSAGGSDAIPFAPMLTHGLIAAVLGGLFATELPPFAYALVMLSVSAALVALPLLGELGELLREDPAGEWASALPVRPRELRRARTLHVLVVLGLLALGSLLPAALFAPFGSGVLGVAARLGLVVAGLAVATVLAAGLLLVQSALGGRAEPLLVAAQMLLFSGVVVGLAAGLRFVGVVQDWTGPEFATTWLWLWPPFVFAGPFAALGSVASGASGAPAGSGALIWLAPAMLGVAALAVLAFSPLPERATPRAGGGLLDRLLSPVRALLTRTWVGRDERGAFDLVYDALPKEREVVLRTYPLLGIPLAFLVLGALGEPGPKRDGLLALVLFTAPTYLPVLLVHVPASESAAAAWLHTTAPVSRASIASGALKAVAARFLLPLYLLLFAVAWGQAGLGFALRLAPVAALVGLLVTRHFYRRLVTDPPLSRRPDDLRTDFDWAGGLMVWAVALTGVAIFAHRWIDSGAKAAGLVLALLAVEWLTDRAWRRRALA